MRVIFDRSAFHADRFDVLVASALRQKVASGQLRVYLTPVFLDATLASAASARSTEAWREHLRFALDVCNGGVFQLAASLWRAELIEGHGRQAEYLVPEPLKQVLELRLREIAASGDLTREWTSTQDGRDRAQQIKANQRALASAVRQDVAAFVKASAPGAKKSASFAEFRDLNLGAAARHLMPVIDPEHHTVLADRWSQDPTQYPYFSTFVEGALYANFYAAFEHNKKIDANAQADYEQLAYLTWADVFVSNDARFLRDAFEAIWRPRGKRPETAESFAQSLSA